MIKVLFSTSFFLWLLFGCATQINFDSTTVHTPLHDDTRVFYLDTDCEQLDPKTKECAIPETRVEIYRPSERGSGFKPETLVGDGDPVSIVINRVVLPRHLFDTLPTEPRDSRTYDIAVILDIAAREGKDRESIAVFYQRGVKADTALAFENILVYSQDTWDNRVPPYFRIRIFSVSRERNERAREALDQVLALSGTLANIASLPFAEPVAQVGVRAAQLVGQGNNEMLVDFQFQLYSSAQTSESGGMPLGLFRKGGVLVAGIPRKSDRHFWAVKDLEYDGKAEAIYQSGEAEEHEDLPFLLATVITTDTVVPNIVKKRSAEIFEVLRNPDTLKEDIEKATEATKGLTDSLQVLKVKETFATNPTLSTFSEYLSRVSSVEQSLSLTLKNWLLATARGVTGFRLSSFSQYEKYIEACKKYITFHSDRRKAELDVTKADEKYKNPSSLFEEPQASS